MRVLITRPLNLAIELAKKITQMGDVAELLPVIEISDTPKKIELQTAINILDKQDMIIFISRSAVDYGMPAIRKRWPTLPNILWAAIGPGTATALESHGITNVIFPKAPPYESEALLALPDFQSLHNKQIYIFRGNGGRALLSNILTTRGAVVKAIETYQRSLPVVNMGEKIKQWEARPIDIIVTTSPEGLHNLATLTQDKLKNIPIIVVGERNYQLAKKLKFKRPIIVTSADDASMIEVLEKFKDKHT
jgi:uroporphyrinogen-III synthase